MGVSNRRRMLEQTCQIRRQRPRQRQRREDEPRKALRTRVNHVAYGGLGTQYVFDVGHEAVRGISLLTGRE